MRCSTRLGARNFELTESGKDAWSIMNWKPKNTCQVQWHEKDTVHSKLMKDQKESEEVPFPLCHEWLVSRQVDHLSVSDVSEICMISIYLFWNTPQHDQTKSIQGAVLRKIPQNELLLELACLHGSNRCRGKVQPLCQLPPKERLDVWQHGECQCECHSLYPGLGSMDFKLGSLNRYGMHCLFSSPRCSSEPSLVPSQAAAHMCQCKPQRTPLSSESWVGYTVNWNCQDIGTMVAILKDLKHLLTLSHF